MGSADAAFAVLDKDGSGQLDTAELKEGLHRLGLGLTEGQIIRLVSTLDEDSSGEISADEFREGLENAVKVRRRR
jgi:Ca2+-binding EF-hand superfamily protein